MYFVPGKISRKTDIPETSPLLFPCSKHFVHSALFSWDTNFYKGLDWFSSAGMLPLLNFFVHPGPGCAFLLKIKSAQKPHIQKYHGIPIPACSLSPCVWFIWGHSGAEPSAVAPKICKGDFLWTLECVMPHFPAGRDTSAQAPQAALCVF